MGVLRAVLLSIGLASWYGALASVAIGYRIGGFTAPPDPLGSLVGGGVAGGVVGAIFAPIFVLALRRKPLARAGGWLFVTVSFSSGALNGFLPPGIGVVLSFLVIIVVVLALTQQIPDVAPPAGCCTKCEYNLTGNVSGICPECGTPVPHTEDSSATAAGGE